MALLLFMPLTTQTLASAQSRPPVDPQLIDHAQILNELSERRRIRSLFHNEQAIFYGLRQQFVNVGKGNLSFVRRDLVTVGRIPITMARVYDSSVIGGADFSSGWQLSLAETITIKANGILQYKNDSAVLSEFIPATVGYKINPAQNSDIKAIDFDAHGLLQISYLTGWSKRFKKLGDRYRLTTIADNNGNEIKLLYNENRLTSVIGDNHRQVDIQRDDKGRIIQITDDQQRMVSYQYNNKDQLSSVIDMAGHQWHYKYHSKDKQQLHKIIDPLGQATAKFNYYNSGKAKSVNISGQKYRYKYAGNTTTVKDNNGNTSTFIQNNQGITTSITNTEGFTSSIILNDRNQITELWHNDLQKNNQQQARITYDDNGRPSQYDINPKPTTLDNEHQQYRYQYNPAGQITSINDNEGRLVSYDYDEKGNLTQRINSNDSHTYRYASNGDVMTETSNKTGRQTFSYNADGLLTTLTNAQKTSQFAYGKTGKLSDITFADGAVHQYRYNKLGFRTAVKRSDNSHVSYIYDSLGNLKTATNTDPHKQTHNQTLTLNQHNQLTQVAISKQPPLTIKYTAKGQPKRISQGDQVSRYRYDKSGRLTDIDSDYGQTHYDYQKGESDIRLQLDDRTRPTQSIQSNISSHDQNQAAFLYARLNGSPWQAVVWNESLGKFLLPSPQQLNAPDAGYQSSKQRRRLYDAIALTQTKQYDFDKASNSFFLPPEYQSANCYYGCTISVWSLQTPLTAKVGCGAIYPVNNNTVAWNSTLNSDFVCGDEVYIDGVGTKMITDFCAICVKEQLDNYISTDGRCANVPDLLSSAKTIKLIP